MEQNNYPPPSPSSPPPQQTVTGYPVDYLNQIAATPRQPGGPSKKVFVIAIAAGLISVIAFFGMMFSNQAPDVKSEVINLNARYGTLAEVSKVNQKHLRDSTMRIANANLSTFLLSASSELAEPAKKVGIADLSKAKVDKKTEKAEESLLLRLNSTFDDASMSGKIDREYAREMNYQLDTLFNMMNTISKSSKSQAVRDYIADIKEKLTVTKKTFSQFAY